MYISCILFPLSAAHVFYQLGASPIEAVVFAVPFSFSLIYLGKGGSFADTEEDYAWQNPFKENRYTLKLAGFCVTSISAVLLSTLFTIGLWQLCILIFLLACIFYNFAC